MSKVGLIGRISFKVPVRVAANKNEACKVVNMENGTLWEYRMALDRCRFVFMEVDKPHRMHHLLTVGYNSILIRGE
jgi:hypothetical protein